VSNSIYEDLEIDFSDMMKDPEAFKTRVFAKAEELKGILKEDNSIENYLNRLPKLTDRSGVGKFTDELDGLYTWADNNLSIQEIMEVAKYLDKLAGQFRYMAKDKAASELASNIDRMDKATAHSQYQALRAAFGEWVKAMKVFGLGEYENLPSMPGNYGQSTLLIHYIFVEKESGEQYRNPRVVSRKLGREPMNLMDAVEFIENNDTNFEVKKLVN
jgi:hypothetical protein